MSTKTNTLDQESEINIVKDEEENIWQVSHCGSSNTSNQRRQLYQASYLLEYEDCQNINNNVKSDNYGYSHSAGNLNQERQVAGASQRFERNQRRFRGSRRRFHNNEETGENRRQHGCPKSRSIRVSKSCTKECDILGGHDSGRRNVDNSIYRTVLNADFMLEILSDEEPLSEDDGSNLLSDFEDLVDLRYIHNEATIPDPNSNQGSFPSPRVSATQIHCRSSRERQPRTSTPKSVSYVSRSEGEESTHILDHEMNQSDMDSLDEMMLNETDSVSIHLNSSQLSSSASSQAYDPCEEECIRNDGENTPSGNNTDNVSSLKAHNVSDSNDADLKSKKSATEPSVKSNKDVKNIEEVLSSICPPKNTAHVLAEHYLHETTGNCSEIDVNCSGQAHSYNPKDKRTDDSQEVKIITLPMSQEKESSYERRDHNDVYHAVCLNDGREEIVETYPSSRMSPQTIMETPGNEPEPTSKVDVNEIKMMAENTGDSSPNSAENRAMDSFSVYLKAKSPLQEHATSISSPAQDLSHFHDGGSEKALPDTSGNSGSKANICSMLDDDRNWSENGVMYLDNTNISGMSMSAALKPIESATYRPTAHNEDEMVEEEKNKHNPDSYCNDQRYQAAPCEMSSHSYDNRNNADIEQHFLNQEKPFMNSLPVSTEIIVNAVSNRTGACYGVFQMNDEIPCTKHEVKTPSGSKHEVKTPSGCEGIDISRDDSGATGSASCGQGDSVEDPNKMNDGNIGDPPATDCIHSSQFDNIDVTLPKENNNIATTCPNESSQAAVHKTSDFLSFLLSLKDDNPEAVRRPRKVKRQKEKPIPDSTDQDGKENDDEELMEPRFPRGVDSQQEKPPISSISVEDQPVRTIKPVMPAKKKIINARRRQRKPVIKKKVTSFDGSPTKEQRVKTMWAARKQQKENALACLSTEQLDDNTDNDSESIIQSTQLSESASYIQGEAGKATRSRLRFRTILDNRNEQEILEEENIRDLETMISYMELKLESKREQKELPSLECEDRGTITDTNIEIKKKVSDAQATIRIQRVMGHAPSIIEQSRLKALRLPKSNPDINDNIGTWDFNIPRCCKEHFRDATRRRPSPELTKDKQRKEKVRKPLHIQDEIDPSVASKEEGLCDSRTTHYLDLLKPSLDMHTKVLTQVSEQSDLKSPRKSKSLTECSSKSPSGLKTYREGCPKESRAARTKPNGEEIKKTPRLSTQEMKKTVTFSTEKETKTKSQNPNSTEKDDEDYWSSTVNAMLLRAERAKLETQTREGQHRFPRSNSASVVHPVRKQGAGFLSHLLEQDKQEQRVKQAHSLCRRKEDQAKQKIKSKKPERKSLVYYRYSDNVPHQIPLQRLPEIDCSHNIVSTSSSAGILTIKTNASRAAQRRAFATHQRMMQMVQKKNKPDSMSPRQDSPKVPTRFTKPINFSNPCTRTIRISPIRHTADNRKCPIRLREMDTSNQDRQQLTDTYSKPKRRETQVTSPCNFLLDQYSDVFDYYSLPYLNERRTLVADLCLNKNTNASSGSDCAENNQDEDWIAYPQHPIIYALKSNANTGKSHKAKCQRKDIDYKSEESEKTIQDNFSTLICTNSINQSMTLVDSEENITESYIDGRSGASIKAPALYLKYGVVDDPDALNIQGMFLKSMDGESIKFDDDIDNLNMNDTGHGQSSQSKGQPFTPGPDLFSEKKDIENASSYNKIKSDISSLQDASMQSNTCNNQTMNKIQKTKEEKCLTVESSEKFKTLNQIESIMPSGFKSSNTKTKPLSISVKGKSIRLKECRKQNVYALNKRQKCRRQTESSSKYGMVRKWQATTDNKVSRASSPSMIPRSKAGWSSKVISPPSSSKCFDVISYLEKGDQSNVLINPKHFPSANTISSYSSSSTCCTNDGCHDSIGNCEGREKNSEYHYKVSDESLDSLTWSELFQNHSEYFWDSKIFPAEKSTGKETYLHSQQKIWQQEVPTYPKLQYSTPFIRKKFLRMLRKRDLLSFITKSEDRLFQCLQAVTQTSHYLPTFLVQSLDPVTVVAKMVCLHFCTMSDNFGNCEPSIFGYGMKTTLVFYRNGNNNELNSLFAVNDVPKGLYSLVDSDSSSSEDALPEPSPLGKIKLARLVQYPANALNKGLEIEGFYIIGPWMNDRDTAYKYEQHLVESFGDDIEKYFQLVLNWTVTFDKGKIFYRQEHFYNSILRLDSFGEGILLDASKSTLATDTSTIKHTISHMGCIPLRSGKTSSDTDIVCYKCGTHIKMDEAVDVQCLQDRTNQMMQIDKFDKKNSSSQLQCKQIVEKTENAHKITLNVKEHRTMAIKSYLQSKSAAARFSDNKNRAFANQNLCLDKPMTPCSHISFSTADGLTDETYKLSYWSTNKIMSSVSPPPFYKKKTSGRVGSRRRRRVLGRKREIKKATKPYWKYSSSDNDDDETSSSSSSSPSSSSSSSLSTTSDSDSETFEHFRCKHTRFSRFKPRKPVPVLLRKFEEKPEARAARLKKVREIQRQKREKEEREDQEQIMYMRKLRGVKTCKEKAGPCNISAKTKTSPIFDNKILDCQSEFDFCPEVPLIKEMWEEVFPKTNFWDKKSKKLQKNSRNYLSLQY